MARSPYANVFFYFRGPSAVGVGDATSRQLEDNTTKALINLLEHSEAALTASWLRSVGIECPDARRSKFFVQGGPASVDAPVRRLVAITAGDGPTDATWEASVAQAGRIDAAVYVPGSLLVVVEAKVAAGLDGGQLDKHAADWGIDRPGHLAAGNLPKAWAFTTWGDMHAWARSLIQDGSVNGLSRFLLAQFAEYLELIDVTPFAGFREDDFLFLEARRSALAGHEPAVPVSEPLQGERLKARLAKLWDAIRAELPAAERDALGVLHVQALRSSDDRVSAQTNREDRQAVNLTVELDPDRLELDLVAWTAPQVDRFDRWLAPAGAAALAKLPEWELVLWRRRAAVTASGRPYWQHEQRAQELGRLRADQADRIEEWLADHRSALTPGLERLAYHVRTSWPRDYVEAAGREMTTHLALAVLTIAPVLASINNAATTPPKPAAQSGGLTLTQMGFVLKGDSDHAPYDWRFVAATAPILVSSPNGMHIRGLRDFIAVSDAPTGERVFIACAITKSYAAGGSEGFLELIAAESSPADAIACANRHLSEWITDQEVYLRDLQPHPPALLDATDVMTAIEQSVAVFVGDFQEIDDAAESSYRRHGMSFRRPDGPVALAYFSNDE